MKTETKARKHSSPLLREVLSEVTKVEKSKLSINMLLQQSWISYWNCVDGIKQHLLRK